MGGEQDDITDEFFTECARLAQGELAKSQSFNLSDAMSAIEMMEPKMDNGMAPIDEGLGLENALRSGSLKPATMEGAELISTMDATVAMLVAWVNLAQLDQTLLTNICLHKPRLLAKHNGASHAFSVAILHLVNALRGYIQLASVYNEEDFSPNSAHDLQAIIDEEAETIDEVLEKAIDGLKPSGTMSAAQVEAVRARLELLQALFELFRHLLPPLNATDEGGDNGSKFSPNFKRARHSVTKCLAATKRVTTSQQLGKAPPKGSTDGDFSWLSSFQPGVNRRLSPASFQRETKLVSRRDALAYLHNFLEKVAVMAIEVPEKMRDLECGLIQMCKDFGGEDSCLLTRSFLQLILMPNDFDICGVVPLHDIVKEAVDRSDLAAFLEPYYADVTLAGGGETGKDRDGLAPLNEVVRDYMGYLSRAFGSLLQCLGHNLARQRDKLLRQCFEDFGVLHAEAEKLEMEIEARTRNSADRQKQQQQVRPTLSTFLLFHLLQLMSYHFELGFRLDLFVPYEFTAVYWYFADFSRSLTAILDQRCNALIYNFSRSTSTLVGGGGSPPRNGTASSTSSTSKKKKQDAKWQVQKMKAETELRKSIALIQQRSLVHNVEIALSVAMFKFTLGLELSGRLRIPPGEASRYERRMEPFASLPPMLYMRYEDYLTVSKVRFQRMDALTPGGEDLKLECFSEAAFHFEQAAKLLKNLENQTDEGVLPPRVAIMLKIAKQNAVVSKLLSSPKLENKNVNFEFLPGERLMFPLIKLL